MRVSTKPGHAFYLCEAPPDFGEEGAWQRKPVKLPDATKNQLYPQNSYAHRIRQKLATSLLPVCVDKKQEVSRVTLNYSSPLVGQVFDFTSIMVAPLEEWLHLIPEMHRCRYSDNQDCVGENRPDTIWDAEFIPFSPALYPMAYDWQRVLFPDAKGRIRVVYITPCGKAMVNERDVRQWLITVSSGLPVWSFCFDPALNPFRVYYNLDAVEIDEDISEGREATAVPVVVPRDLKFAAIVSLRKLKKTFR